MSRIHPRVKALARDLGAVRTVQLTPRHRTDYLNGLARTIQVAIDDYFLLGLPDDREWPDHWQADENTEARKRSQALTESGDSIAHVGAK